MNTTTTKQKLFNDSKTTTLRDELYCVVGDPITYKEIRTEKAICALTDKPLPPQFYASDFYYTHLNHLTFGNRLYEPVPRRAGTTTFLLYLLQQFSDAVYITPRLGYVRELRRMFPDTANRMYAVNDPSAIRGHQNIHEAKWILMDDMQQQFRKNTELESLIHYCTPYRKYTVSLYTA